MQPGPGDVYVIRTRGLAAWTIRLGEMLQGKPDLHNHVAVLDHITPEGVAWFLEGRPSGLGWHAEGFGTGKYTGSKWTISNAEQPKTPGQRQLVVLTMREMIGKPYDWEAIEGDAAAAMHLPELWSQWGGKMPGHVVCSSSAAYAYISEAHLAAPQVGGGRFTEPGDWDSFIMRKAWA
jgi:hypothetical protein